MAQPTGSDIHVDEALSNIAIAYKNKDYIAEALFPLVPVEKQSDKYYIWTKAFWFRNQVEKRTPGDTYPEAGLELSTDEYFCDIFHLAFPIPFEDRRNQDPAVQLEETAAEFLADQFLLSREIGLAAAAFATSKWGTDRTLSGTDQWSDYDNSTPLADISLAKETIRKATGQMPNVLVLGEEVKNVLKMHPNLVDLFKYTNASILTNEQIRQAMEMETLLVGSAIQNTAKEGATFAGAYIWGKNALLLHVRPGGMRIPTAGLTMVWQNIDGNGQGLTVPITSVREDGRDRDVIRGKHAYDHKIVATDLGYFIETAVA